MIEGVKVHLSSAEIIFHAKASKEYHLRKAEWYEKQVNAMRTSLPEGRPLEEEEETVTYTSNSSSKESHIRSLESSRQYHLKRAAYFATIERYLPTGEMFQVGQHELETVGWLEHTAKNLEGIEIGGPPR